MTAMKQEARTAHKIAPCIWFDDQAKEAAEFYTSIFPDSRIVGTSHYPEKGENPSGKPPGSLLTVEFEITGIPFTALNGGPQFVPNPSISFFLNFDPARDPKAREKLDAMWERLAPGGIVRMALDTYPYSERYGWIEDRFGVSWQLMLLDPAGEPRPFIVPCLLFVRDVAGRAAEAMRLYSGIFADSREGLVVREPDTDGSLMFADFTLHGQWFAAMDSAHPAHSFGFNEAVSFQVLCRDQAEVDHFWSRLAAGGEEGPCGWLKDRFGVSWQVVPTRLIEILRAGGATGPGWERAFQAMLTMQKIDIATLEKAYREG